MSIIKLKINNEIAINRQHLIGWTLVMVLLLYGVFSAPFPDEFGWPESIIGIFLILISISQLSALIDSLDKGENVACAVSFIWMIFIPSLIGVFRWNFSDMIRDIIPLFYLFLPMILAPWAKKIVNKPFIKNYLVLAIVIAGGGFALRYFTSQGIGYADLGLGVYLINLKYYSYDPTVTFTAIFGLLFSLTMFQYPLKSLILIAVSLLAIGALGGIAQRAPLALLCLLLIIFLFRYANKYWMRVVISTFVLLLIIISLRNVIFSLFSIFVDKTQAVGVNGKIEEIQLILKILSSSWFNVLFGLGWGGVYYNSVIEGDVRFSHSIIGFYLLKTGIIGSIVMSFYVLWLVNRYIKVLIYAWRNDVTQLPLVFAIGSAPIISMLQPTYKTLSFGLILTLIPVLYLEMKKKMKKNEIF